MDAQAAIRTLAAVAARRRGLADPRPLEQRARALIGAHIWRRAALMALSCLQQCAPADAVALLPADDWDDDEWECDYDGSDGDGAAAAATAAAALAAGDGRL